MIYFSGFSLAGESEIFREYLDNVAGNPYVVAGFSYGAIKAVEYACTSTDRIDKIILLSPAYFVGQSPAFIKAQLRYYKKDPVAYIEKFFVNAAYPTSYSLKRYSRMSTVEELEELLFYPWSEEKLLPLIEKGINIETYLGGRDRIVDAEAAHDFFKKYTTSYLFKPFGHLLR
ncbi:pimelyl-ACP methyl ester esterase BioV [Hydrogenimonas sp.]|uniref:pimelyl-ACP methyl ester esterase BioV n=1 Tax=Hydrogenimonas sp. TaxID=2231112 RepID=UPI00262E887D|nr:pimelyl-ACP methyl ester esterase BioV [Hydrogenimonas sp.]